jgi:glycosyltransferase involved in cell wall biosynthesis
MGAGNELVSIVCTLYNYKRYIRDLITSVITQTYRNWELIIVDDGSEDNPYEAIKSWYRLRMTQIRYVRFSENRGYALAKNEGIVRTKGEYIVMIDADDMLLPDSLKIRKELLDANPNKLWCHGECLVTNTNGTEISERSRNWKRKYREKLLRQGRDLTKDYCHGLIHAQSVMVRPELHKKYGLYDESLRFSADNEMWRRVIRFGEVPAHTDEFVAVYRVHPDRMVNSEYKRKRMHKVKTKIIKDVERRFEQGINNGNTKLWI